MQSRKMSIIETLANTTIGFVIAVISQMILFPVFGIFVSMETNIYLVVSFTIISIIRGYVVRRFFEKIGGDV